MDKLLFGPAGVPLSAKDRSTVGGVKEVANLGLGCMEIEFVRGVRMSEKIAKEVQKVAKEKGVVLTVHAPYFINLNSSEKDKVKASIQRILDSAHIGAICGAKFVTFHAAYYGKDDPKDVYKRVKNALKEIVKIIKDKGWDIEIRPETTGKISQFGTVDELIKLAHEIDTKPCIDFAHIYARSLGEFNGYDKFNELIDKLEKELGKEFLKEMHIHLSGIEYGKSGETKHTPVKESNFKWKDVLKVLKEREICGVVISESPILEQDALLMQNEYEKL